MSASRVIIATQLELPKQTSATERIDNQKDTPTSNDKTKLQISRDAIAEVANSGPRAQFSEIIGDYGPYQAYLTILLFSRYLLLGLMSNAGPLLAPDVNFYCVLPLQEMITLMPNITHMEPKERDREIKEELRQVCQLDLSQYRSSSANAMIYHNISNNNTRTTNYPNFNSTSSMMLLNQRSFTTMKYRECNQFNYEPQAPDQARTLTTEFDLVCEREVLRSVFQSALSASIVIGHVFWGTFSDKYGRFTAQRWCLAISLLSGLLSVFASDFWTLTIARALCSFGDLGLVVSLTTNMVELVGSKYRGVSVSVVNFGSALGVALLPYIVSYYEDFRLVLMFSVLCHMITAPFILLTNESVRWLLANGKNDRAQKELVRIWRWNATHSRLLNYISGRKRKKRKQKQLSPSPEPPATIATFATTSAIGDDNSTCVFVESEVVTVECQSTSINVSTAVKRPLTLTATAAVAEIPGCGQKQAECINLVAHQLSFVGRVNRLFRDKQLMIAVLTIVWTTFNSELLYTSFIIINLEVGENKYLNYLLGACMEGLAAIVSSALLWYAPRRESLATFWTLISASCFGLSVAHVDSHWAVWFLALAKFLQSSLSSIAMVAAYEAFPTSLRQSGSGLVFTLGMLGSVFAPLIFTELDDQDHLDLVLMTFSLLSLSAGVLIYWRLKETKDSELQ